MLPSLSRYRKDSAKSFQYVDVPASSGGVFELENLSADTEYVFSIRSINAIGKSHYVSDIGKIRTKSESQELRLISSCYQVNGGGKYFICRKSSHN